MIRMGNVFKLSAVAMTAVAVVLGGCEDDTPSPGAFDFGNSSSSSSSSSSGESSTSSSSSSSSTGGVQPKDAGTSSDGSASSVPCTIKLTGAVTGEYPCNPNGAFDPQKNVSGVVIMKTTSEAPQMTFTISKKGELTTGTIDYAGAEAGGMTVSTAQPSPTSAAPTWVAAKDANDPTGNRGTFSVALTTVSATSVGTAKLYKVGGKVTATLTPVDSSGATGNVTAVITF